MTWTDIISENTINKFANAWDKLTIKSNCTIIIKHKMLYFKPIIAWNIYRKHL